MLERMNHRGGTGAEPDTGDGAGVLMALPDPFSSNCFSGRDCFTAERSLCSRHVFAARTRIRSQIKKGRCSGYSANGISGVVAAGSSL